MLGGGGGSVANVLFLYIYVEVYLWVCTGKVHTHKYLKSSLTEDAF